MSTGRLTIAKGALVAACLAAIAGCDTAALSRDGAPSTSAAPGPGAPQARYQIDSTRNRIWVLTHDGVQVYDVAAPKRIPIPLPDWVLANEAYACLPGLALGPKGEAVVTSNVVPTLWKIDPETLAVTAHPLVLDADSDKEVGFTGLVYSAEYAAFFAVSSAHGSLWKIDPLLTKARNVPLPEPIRGACRLGALPHSAKQPSGVCLRTAAEVLDVNFSPTGRSAWIAARRFPPLRDAPGFDERCGLR